MEMPPRSLRSKSNRLQPNGWARSISVLGTLVCIVLIVVRVSTGDWRAPALAGAMLVGIVGLHAFMQKRVMMTAEH
jgi:hypothetical protein